MAGSPSIEQIVAQIRTALFGKDVRENIALGIEKTYADVTEVATQVTQDVEEIQEDIEEIQEDVEALKQEITIDNGINIGLNNSIELLSNHYETVIVNNANFEIGAITNSGGQMSYPSSTTRVRTRRGILYPLKKNAIIKLTDYSTVRFLILYYNTSGALRTSSWIESNYYVCPEDGTYAIVLEYKNQATITDKNLLVSLLKMRDFYVYDDPDINNAAFWEVGSVSGAGAYTTTNTRCRTRPFFVKAGDIITCKRGTPWDLSYTLFSYDGSTVIESSAWLTEKAIAYDGIAVILCRNGGNQPLVITESLISELVETIKFVRKPFNYYPLYLPKYHGIAHSGGRFGPRNNAITYANAYKEGFRYVETDVAITYDGKYVCVHDATINSVARYSDGSEISGDVHVNEETYAQLLEYDFGIAYSQEYTGTKVSLFSEVLDVCQKLGLFLYVDFSSEVPYTYNQIKEIMDIVNASGMKEKVAYVPANMDYVDYILKYDNSATIGLVRSASQYPYAYRCFTGNNAVFMMCQYGTITAERVEALIGMNVPLEAYTINSSSDLENLPKYVTGVTSDDICADKYWREKLTT